MKVLAFDTSALSTSVALLSEGDLLAEVILNTSMNHSVTLMPTIDFLMKQVGLSPSDLDRIVVAQGPGSYTGLRIAVTLAKTLAYTLGIELIGISSLHALALNIEAEGYVVPLMNARRGMVYAAVYQTEKTIITDQYTHLDDFLEGVKEFSPLIFTGDAKIFESEILEKFPNARIVTDAPKNLPSAFKIAKISEKLLPVTNVHDFNPIYLKKVEAEEKWEEASGLVADDKDLVSLI